MDWADRKEKEAEEVEEVDCLLPGCAPLLQLELEKEREEDEEEDTKEGGAGEAGGVGGGVDTVST